MTIEAQCRDLLVTLNHTDIPLTLSTTAIMSLIDLTLLDKNISSEAIIELNTKGHAHQCAAICVYPTYLPYITLSAQTKRATVINFPNGTDALKIVLNTIDDLAKNRAVDEIDYVFPYQAFLSGDSAYALSHATTVIQHCKANHFTTKIIIESGAFSNLTQLYDACLRLLDTECHFLKTSTGKHIPGASLESAFVILKALSNQGANCGIKLSGGIRSLTQLTPYLALTEQMIDKTINNTWFRVGTSTVFI